MAGFTSDITIVGNVGNEPTLTYTATGVAVCNLTVAVTRISGSGERRTESTQWYGVSVWNERAETAHQIIRKGAQLLVSGRLELTAYINKAGEAVASPKIHANTYQLLGKREQTEGAYEPASNGSDNGSDLGSIPF